MKKIKQLGELPHWFGIERYQNCHEYRAADWLGQLWLRWEAMCDLDQADRLRAQPGTDLGAIEQAQSSAQQMLELIAEDPAPAPGEAVKPLSDPVRGLRWDDLAYLPAHEMRPDNPRPVGQLATGFDTVYLAGIDLNAPNSVLIEAFRRWLAQTRASQRKRGKPPKRQRPEYRRWADWGLLPYLDLRLWERITGSQLTHATMAEAVCGTPNEQHIHRRLKAVAEHLPKHLETLRGLSAAENPEKLRP